MVTAEVATDDTTEYRRRVVRSLKNVFQSSSASFLGGAADEELARMVVRTAGEARIELWGREHVWRSIGDWYEVVLFIRASMLIGRAGCFWNGVFGQARAVAEIRLPSAAVRIGVLMKTACILEICGV